MAQTFTLIPRPEGATTVLQLCHGYGQPFLDVARQTVSLFAGTKIVVTTVYLTGGADALVAEANGGDEVIFLEFSSRQIRGLKRAAIAEVTEICRQRDIHFAVAHRYKPLFVASHVPGFSQPRNGVGWAGSEWVPPILVLKYYSFMNNP